jgi:ribose 5-phosphate isomerase B
MRIAIGSDEAGFELKAKLLKYIGELKHEVEDLGCFDESPVVYADVAVRVATEVKDGRADRGILVCGTGIGMAIAANKVPGIRAAQCHDTYSAERAAKSNDAQVMTLGARVIGAELAKSVVRAYLGSSFADGPSTPKIRRIMEYEASLHAKA